MSGIKTHYDNLKVARNAPPEVIRSAYRALSSKYHPDKNPGDPKTERIMKLINRAYEVLSDPVKRRRHDMWIERVEAANPQKGEESERTQRKNGTIRNQGRLIKTTGSILSAIFQALAFVLIIIFVVYAGVAQYASSLQVAPDDSATEQIDTAIPYSNGSTENDGQGAPAQAFPARTAASEPDYGRTPNGSPWPSAAGYLEGHEVSNKKGLSSVTIDNSQNGANVFVKLVSRDDDQLKVTRQFFIPGRGSFTLADVSPGAYDIRYRDLSNGGLSRSEEFIVQEYKTDGGVRYSVFTITIYKVEDGNMETYPLSEEGFL